MDVSVDEAEVIRAAKTKMMFYSFSKRSVRSKSGACIVHLL